MNSFEFVDELIIFNTRILKLSECEDFVVLVWRPFDTVPARTERGTDGRTSRPYIANTELGPVKTGARNWRKISGVDLWRRFLAFVSLTLLIFSTRFCYSIVSLRTSYKSVECEDTVCFPFH